MFVRGIGEGNANVYSLTMRQQVIPPDQLTRSAGAYTQVIYGSIPLGALLAGLTGETFGPRTAVLLGAIGLVLSALPILTPKFVRLRDTRSARCGRWRTRVDRGAPWRRPPRGPSPTG